MGVDQVSQGAPSGSPSDTACRVDNGSCTISCQQDSSSASCGAGGSGSSQRDPAASGTLLRAVLWPGRTTGDDRGGRGTGPDDGAAELSVAGPTDAGAVVHG